MHLATCEEGRVHLSDAQDVGQAIHSSDGPPGILGINLTALAASIRATSHTSRQVAILRSLNSSRNRHKTPEP